MNGDQPLHSHEPPWSWFVFPDDNNPYGIRRRRKPDTLKRWEWKVVAESGPSVSVDDERAARRMRRQLNRVAS